MRSVFSIFLYNTVRKLYHFVTHERSVFAMKMHNTSHITLHIVRDPLSGPTPTRIRLRKVATALHCGLSALSAVCIALQSSVLLLAATLRANFTWKGTQLEN